jgi:broad specificity phosphatase PhoE
LNAASSLPALDFEALPLCFFVRHGQTGYNADGRLQGQTDTDMSDFGRTQADRNGRILAGLVENPEAFDFVASPLKRTRETMERVRAAMGLDPEEYRTDPRIMELNFGAWQGFTYAEVEARDPGIMAKRAADKWGFVPPGEGAESYAMLEARVAPFLGELRRPTVCVTHGGILRAVMALSGAMTEEEASMAPQPQDKILRIETGRLDWL